MYIYILMLVAIAIGFSILLCILCYLNYTKLYTFDDFSRPDLHRERGGIIPTPYQLVYVSNEFDVWTFEKNESFYKDWKSKRISSMLMGGRLYSIDDIALVASHLVVRVTGGNPSTSFVGSRGNHGAVKGTSMFVLGYELSKK